MLNRLLDLAALLILSGAAIFWMPAVPGIRNFVPSGSVALPAVVVAAALVIFVFVMWRSKRLAAFLQKHGVAFDSFRRPAWLVAPLAASLGIQFGFLALTDWITRSGGLALPITAWMFAWPLAKLLSMLPLTVGGIGTRELALAALLAPFGAPAGRIAATALAWDAVIIIGSLAGGLIWKGLGWSRR
jgi:uncharacterized membrane protein YbhN (UPF0104 family)